MSSLYGSAVTPGGRLAAQAMQALDVDLQDRFSDRARALFYARLAFLTIGLGVLAVPSWAVYLGAGSTPAFAVYFAVIGYSVANYLLLDHPRFGRTLTFVTLILDLIVLTLLAVQSGGLTSPMMAGQVVFTIFFALLFPKPIAMIPPLLILPVVAALDQLSAERGGFGKDVFLLVWYVVLNFVAAYVLVYLNARDDRHLIQLRELSSTREQSLVTEERLRLAREIHDGLGGTLSTLIIQAEFIQRLAKDNEKLYREISDLKDQAEEAIEELRRSLTMMRRDFNLHKALDEHCHRFRERWQIPCQFKLSGRPRRLPSEMQLAIFRILQECLANIQKHAKAKSADVHLRYDGDIVSLTIADDGVGFDTRTKKPGHYGLINMGERVKKFRGTADVQSAPGAGTTIHVTFVVPAEGSHVAMVSGLEAHA